MSHRLGRRSSSRAGADSRSEETLPTARYDGSEARAFRPPDMRDVELPILHRDPEFLLLDKPSGLLSIPGRGPYARDSVVGRVAAWHPEAEGSLMVHRLDMDCSGLIIVALTKQAQRALAGQFEARTIQKTYHAIVEGKVERARGRIELAFRLDPNDRPRQVYDPLEGKVGITEFSRIGHETLSERGAPNAASKKPTGLQDAPDPTVVADGLATSRIRFEPLTGRTHQLRLAAAHELGLGRPIVGDRLYGNPLLAPRLMLHATRLVFHHPRSGERLCFESPAPF